MLDREDVESLREEIADGLSTLTATLSVLQGADADGDTYDDALQSLGAQLKNITMGANLVGLDGLAEAGTFVERNLEELPGRGSEGKAAVFALLQRWPQLCLSYLEAPVGPDAACEILTTLASPDWPTPLDPEARARLAQLFAQLCGDLGDTHDAGAPAALEAAGQTDQPDAELPRAEEEGASDSDAPGNDRAIEAVAVPEVDADPAPAGLEPVEQVGVGVTDGRWMLPAAVVDREVAEPGDPELPVAAGLPEEGSASDVSTEESLADLAGSENPSLVPTEQGSHDEAAVSRPDSEPVDGEASVRLSEAHSEAEEAEPSDVLALIRSEFAQMRDELNDAVETFLRADADDPVLMQALERCQTVIERLSSACDLVGLEGLQEVCAAISNNVLELAGQDKADRMRAHTVLAAWPEHVLAYLQNTTDDSACKTLVGQLQDASWPSPLTDADAKELLARLVEQPSAADASAEESERPTLAQAEDVALQMPDDVSQDLLEAFLHEAPLHAAELSRCLQKVYEGSANADDIKLAQRIAHTLKGSAHLTGVRAVATFTHHMEDILEFLATHHVSPPQPLVNTLAEAADCLEALIEALTHNQPAPANALVLLQQILDWANRFDKGDIREGDVGAAQKPMASPLAATPGEQVSQTAPSLPSDSGAAPQEVLRVPTGSIDELLRLVGELSMSINQIQDRYRRALEHMHALREQDSLVQERSFELEDLVDIRGVGVLQGGLRRTGTHDETFDPLELNEYNELHSTTQGVIEAAADARELGAAIHEDLVDLEELLVKQHRLNKLLQQAVVGTRMVPVKNIVSRLQRTVRQTSRATQKQAQLEVTGEDILIDGEVLQKLSDPLMHILRNAVDHGIESAVERARQGKPEAGKIGLHFSRVGNTILVHCEDDGRGLDYEQIRRVGVERGLIEPGAAPHHSDLAQLLYTPGFSTHSQVTHTSGRGIGLDVVYTAVIGMKGSLEIESREGWGCTIVLRLPVSLITAHVLLVHVQGQLYGIPTTNLEQILAAGTATVEQADEEPMLRLGDDAYPLMSVAAMLNLRTVETDHVDALTKKPALLVHTDRGVVAVAVDRVVDGRDLVVKNMGRFVRSVTGVLGASILGDGTVVPVLDIPEILRAPVRQIASLGAVETEDAEAADNTPCILIVDDSLSARRTMSQLVSDAGYRSLVAKDGLEAVDVLQETRPDLVLVDLEMPRMNGLELTAHLRTKTETKDLPVIVVTSRSTEKHRKQAMFAGATAYMTKPFQESELLDVIEASLHPDKRRAHGD